MADGLDRKDATTPENDLGTEAEPAPVVDGEAGDDGGQPDPLPADRIKDDGIVNAFADPVSRCVAVQAEEQIAVLRRQRAGI